MKISKSKRQLAQLLIEAGVKQFHGGANWAAQDKRNPHKDDAPGITLYASTPEKPLKGEHYWGRDTTSSEIVMFVETNTLIPNWHQTALSRAEFDQIVAESAVTSEPEPQCCESVTRSIPEPTGTPTLDQLLQDWRNAEDYAQRKQAEAEEAAAMRDERWRAVQARAGEFSVTVGRCEKLVVESEVVVADYHHLRIGDVLRCKSVPSGARCRVGDEGTLKKTEDFALEGGVYVDVCGRDWFGVFGEHWEFIRRP